MREQIRDLKRYSMVEGEGQSISVHPLVQTVQRFQLGWPNSGQQALQNCLELLSKDTPGDPQDVRTWSRWELLAPHYLKATDCADQFGITDPTARLLNNVAQLFKAKAQFDQAEPLMRRALEIDEQSFGKDHPKVASRLNNLAQLLKATNRLAEAEPLMRRALEIDEQSFGKDHPNVARDLNNLAQLLQDTNRLAEAEPLIRRALEIDEQSFGKDHPKVAIRLNNLAALLQQTNRLAEAEPLMRRALEIDEQSFG
uniref:tetratricopeptide repeat protein n=1 Tax=uncultured Rubinisphaera sp. TaxID=1678686 RepID=UPI0030D90925